MTVEQQPLVCHVRKGVVTDCRVVAEFPVRWYEWAVWKDGKHQEGTMEDYGKCLESKCKEFESFLRDHRSQDIVSLSVERERKDLCSCCGSTWELDDSDGIKSCASCGAVLEE